MYKAKVAVCSDTRTKNSTQSEHHVEILNVKNLVVRKEIGMLKKVNITLHTDVLITYWHYIVYHLQLTEQYNNVLALYSVPLTIDRAV